MIENKKYQPLLLSSLAAVSTFLSFSTFSSENKFKTLKSYNDNSSNQPLRNKLNNSFKESAGSIEAANKTKFTNKKISVDEDVVLSAKKENPKVISHSVVSGDNLISILRSFGISASTVTDIIYSSKGNKKPFKVNIGDRIVADLGITYKDNPKVIIEPKGSRYFYEIKKEKNRFLIEEVEHAVNKVKNSVSFKVDNNFYTSAKNNSLSSADASIIHNVLKSKVDFSKIKKGTEVKAVIERSYVNGSVVGSNDILFASIKVNNKTYKAYLWSEGDENGYYDENGNSLTASFLRHPVKNPRITSNYNPNRLHPILKIVRPHNGVDYGGPTGTPIYAIGDGKIIHAGKRGGFGNTVMIKHNGGIQTLSAHMNSIKKGVYVGKSVKKGEVIGYIGQTGLSTGPHLHFEMRVNGKLQNPRTYPLPMSSKVKDLNGFKEHIKNFNYR